MGLLVSNIRKTFSGFSGQKFILNMNTEIKTGEMTALLGPSGCGKSTTLSLIAGIMSPDEGKIVMDGRNISNLPTWRRNIGMVFQDYALFPHLSVKGNISYGLKMKNHSKKEIEIRVQELLELVKLPGFGGRKINELSGGQRQRVALARALAPNPSILLLDEPLSALDANLRKSIRREIRSIQSILGLTVLYVTHDQEEALTISDRIILLKDGNIEQESTPEELYNHPASTFTANFVGTSNLLRGIIQKDSDSSLKFRPDGFSETFTLPCSSICDPRPGDEGWLFFRPENAFLAQNSGEYPSRSADGNPAEECIVLEGKPLFSEFLGTCYRWEIITENDQLIFAESIKGFRQGISSVQIHVPLKSCSFIPSERSN